VLLCLGPVAVEVVAPVGARGVKPVDLPGKDVAVEVVAVGATWSCFHTVAVGVEVGAVGHGIPVQVVDLIRRDDAVAVGIDTVAGFHLPGMDIWGAIIAIAFAGAVAVSIGVEFVGWHHHVAVVVGLVAELRGARVGVWVGVVAVRLDRPPVAIGIGDGVVVIAHVVVARVVVIVAHVVVVADVVVIVAHVVVVADVVVPHVVVIVIAHVVVIVITRVIVITHVVVVQRFVVIAQQTLSLAAAPVDEEGDNGWKEKAKAHGYSPGLWLTSAVLFAPPRL